VKSARFCSALAKVGNDVGNMAIICTFTREGIAFCGSIRTFTFHLALRNEGDFAWLKPAFAET
jgi:hypothetical protein